MGLVDYISRDPQQKAVKISAYDEQFIVAKLNAVRNASYQMQKITSISQREIHLQNKPQIIQIPLTKYAVNSHREIQNIVQSRIMITQLTN